MNKYDLAPAAAYMLLPIRMNEKFALQTMHACILHVDSTYNILSMDQIQHNIEKKRIW